GRYYPSRGTFHLTDSRSISRNKTITRRGRRMQKKALILAVSAAFVMPMAFAKGGEKGEKADPDSVVELYGKVYPELVFPSSSGATSTGSPTCTICGAAAGDNAI